MAINPNIETPPENSTIKHLRETTEKALSDKAEADRLLAEATAKLTEIERSKLEESERLKLELKDATEKAQEVERLRDANGRYTSTFKTMYEGLLQSVPEAQRPILEQLTKSEDYAEAVQKLQSAMVLIPQNPNAPRPLGTPTSPTIPGVTPPPPVTPPPARDPKDWGKVSFEAIVAERTEQLGKEQSHLPKE